ncbi:MULTISPECIES: ATP-binding protein [unclassified Bradyrhizobium]|uniref:ATP-binding protein n=1 Tax=unclassified Bradyrhizobium TaxID=2631580 RepID=UPI0023050867|nr:MULTISPECIES: ATP-binding protein [unclassified Bradyrhizobium]MDA9450764.1 hypothetical protein [Bradyrhizobium sp. CCBAU 21360]MDA9458515.1 hypothetical protein [Bradyrhizobium sp. CCBAU 21359]
MSIKIDLANQVRQTVLPQWKPLLPLFEAVMNSLQAIRDANLPRGAGIVTIAVSRELDTFLKEENPPIIGFEITDNGIGLDDDNFDSFNTAFSRRKVLHGGKGLGRFTWLKAFDGAHIDSTFRAEGALLSRSYLFDERYTLDTPGLPIPATSGWPGTTVTLTGLKRSYKEKIPRSIDVIVQKLIEHFILVFIEPDCPRVYLIDQGQRYDINDIFEKDYKAHSSKHEFAIGEVKFTLHGFRLPTSRTTKHKLVYAADQRGVTSDKLEDYVPNLASRLEDENGEAFFYLAIVQSPYLSEHVNIGRTDFDFSAADDADVEPSLFDSTDLIPRAQIRERALEFIEQDLENIIETINTAKMDKIRRYVATDAPQYKILLKDPGKFINKLPPSPSRNDIETALHRELHHRETELKREGGRIIREADKIDNYEDYHRRFTQFLDEYNELGVSALAQYVSHRKIIIEFLERAISLPRGEGAKYPLEEVVHRLVFPMQTTNLDIPYNEQNLWMIDERLTYHSFIASDKQLRSLEMLHTKSAQRGDIVVFDEKILFSDMNPAEHPINSITTIEFKRPGRDDYNESDNPLAQAFKLIEEIRNGEFQIRGRPVPVSNKDIPASIYCVCDLTPTFRRVLKVLDAFVTPDNQGYYGFHRGFNAYYEVIDYTKMLRDAKNRNRVFFEKLNLVNNH